MHLQVGVKALIERDNTYLFLRRSNSFKQSPQEWDIPGGRIEPAEALNDALSREIFEETGLRLAETGKLLAAQDIFVTDKDVHVVRLTYLASAAGEISISDEHDQYKWMSVDDILTEPHVDPYLKEVIVRLSND